MSRASWFEFTAILCENAHHHTDYSSAQWAVTSNVVHVSDSRILQMSKECVQDRKPLFGVEDLHDNFQVCCLFDNGCHKHSSVLGRCYVLLPSVAQLPVDSVYGVITAVNAGNLRLSFHD